MAEVNHGMVVSTGRRLWDLGGSPESLLFLLPSILRRWRSMAGGSPGAMRFGWYRFPSPAEIRIRLMHIWEQARSFRKPFPSIPRTGTVPFGGFDYNPAVANRTDNLTRGVRSP